MKLVEPGDGTATQVEAGFDKYKLPSRSAWDTSALIRALGQRPSDPRTDLTSRLFATLLNQPAQAAQVLIPSVALMELMRFHRAPILPRTSHIVVVAFDERAALEVAAAFPWTSSSGKNSETRANGDFDRMIVGCAVRHHADCLITLDTGSAMIDAAKQLGMTLSRPIDFLAPVYQKAEQANWL